MRSIALFFLCLLLTSQALAERWPASLEPLLRKGKVVSSASLSDKVENWDGSNPYLLLTLEGGVSGVFRSEDDPWGSVAEVCGYRIDQELGTDLVPPTVARTLRREELGDRWPWKSNTRQGSLQLFVEGAKPANETQLSSTDLANSEILNFVLGRYDNHSGNLLVAPDGRAVLIDLEGMLDHQKVRYGDFPFLKRGGYFESKDGLPSTQPFPFDHPRKLVDPTLQEIHQAFDPWWGQYWPQGMDALFHLLDGITNRTIPYAIWGNRLWVQVRVKSRHASHTDYYPGATIQALRRLTAERLQQLLTPPFEPSHVREILSRRDLLLSAASTAKEPQDGERGRNEAARNHP